MAKKISGERLDVVLQRLRQSGETDQPGKPAAATVTEQFDALFGSAGVDERKAQEPDTLQAEIIDFTIPRITEPNMFHSARFIALLEHFLDDLLPNLDESDELLSLAARVIGDEISRQRDVLERLQSGIAA